MSGGAIAYLNGDYLPAGEARVSVLDRGFLFADGVYEVIPVYDGRPFTLDQHLRRLERSLAEIRIANPHTRREWEAIAAQLIEQNGGVPGPANRLVYFQVTRGASASRAHAFPPDTAPTVVGLCNEMAGHGANALTAGVCAITLPDIRWGRCDIKSVALLANVLATQAAREQGCNEAILHRDGVVTEGSSSNVFAVLDGVAVTPPEGPAILSGITRGVVELLRANGLRIAERRIGLEQLRSAPEIWLTSATREVLPVTRLDGKPVGDGQPGTVWRKAHALFQEFKRRA